MKGKVNAFHVERESSWWRTIPACIRLGSTQWSASSGPLFQAPSFTTVPSVILVDSCSEHVCQNKEKLSERKTTHITVIHQGHQISQSLSKSFVNCSIDTKKVNERITQDLMNYGDMIADVITYIISQREFILCPTSSVCLSHSAFQNAVACWQNKRLISRIGGFECLQAMYIWRHHILVWLAGTTTHVIMYNREQ